MSLTRATTFALVGSLAALLGACAAPQTQTPAVESAAAEMEAKKQRELVLDAFITTQSRLDRVGYPVLQAAVPLCEDRRRHTTGAWFWTQDVFPESLREAAASKFGATNLVQVGIVREGSPAAAAGLQLGDIPVKLDDWDVPTGPGAFKDFVEHLDAVLRSPTASPIVFSVRRGQRPLDVTVTPMLICDYRLVVERSDAKNAFADGERVVIFQGLMEFLNTDEELATVVAHEVAHNAMGHVESQTANAVVGGLFGLALDIAAAAAGVNTQGGFTRLGSQAGSATYSVEFEQEADYVGAYLMSNAGFNAAAAPNLWRRMAIQNPQSIELRSSHPTTPERFVALEETVRQIEYKRQAGLPLTPEFKKQPATAPATESSSSN